MGALQAFSCHEFDEGAGSWLMEDVAVACGTPEHDAIIRTAWIGVGLYPIGMLVTNALLLLAAHRAILREQPTGAFTRDRSLKATATCRSALRRSL